MYVMAVLLSGLQTNHSPPKKRKRFVVSIKEVKIALTFIYSHQLGSFFSESSGLGSRQCPLAW